jgi:hypothetical protein
MPKAAQNGLQSKSSLLKFLGIKTFALQKIEVLDIMLGNWVENPLK